MPHFKKENSIVVIKNIKSIKEKKVTSKCQNELCSIQDINSEKECENDYRSCGGFSDKRLGLMNFLGDM